LLVGALLVGALLVGALLAGALVGGRLGVHSLKDEEKKRSKQQRTSNEEQIRTAPRMRKKFASALEADLFGTSLVRSAKRMVSKVQRQIVNRKTRAELLTHRKRQGELNELLTVFAHCEPTYSS
jgi:hypothetical protein